MNKQYKTIIVLSIILIGLLIDFSMNYSKEPIDTNIVFEEPEITTIEEPEITPDEYTVSLQTLISTVCLLLVFLLVSKWSELD